MTFFNLTNSYPPPPLTMKTITKKIIFFTTLLLSVSFLSFAQTTVDFSYTGSPQEWIVPCGVTEIEVNAYGASGGNHSTNGFGFTTSGGQGGSVSSTIAVTPGEILYIYVGGQGKHCEGAGTSSCGNLSGGWNGGGTGGKSGSGGGSTDIRIGSQSLDDRVLVAGAGGGSRIEYFYDVDYMTGGAGGGLEGQNAILDTYGDPANSWGGTQSSGGASHSDGYTNGAGSFGNGGFGLTEWGGGGGGAGWYGGSGGFQSGGAGGSSYVDPSRTISVVHTQGGHVGNGTLTISYSLGDVGSCYVDECGVINGNGYYYFYADNDSDGLGEGDLITTCSDLSQQFCGTLSVSSGYYASEVSWNIQSSSGTEVSGGAPYSSEFCLNQGDYTVNMYDSYGDGWNGSSLSFNGQSFSFSSGSSSSGSLSINSGNTESFGHKSSPFVT